MTGKIFVGCPECGEEIRVEYMVVEPEPRTETYPGTSGGVVDAAVTGNRTCTCLLTNQELIPIVEDELAFTPAYDDGDRAYDDWKENPNTESPWT